MNAPEDGEPGLIAGAGRAEIRLPAHAFPVDGFTGVHDPLHVRVLLLDDGERRTSIVSVELTSLPDDVVDRVRDLVAQLTGGSPDAVLVAATHTFSAPHLEPGSALDPREGLVQPLARALVDATRQAVATALRSVRPARLGGATAITRIAVNRDIPTADGWWLGADDAAETDPEVGVVRIEDHDAVLIAVLLCCAVQSSVMNGSVEVDGGRLVGGDLAGAAARHVEREYGEGVTALFLIGAAGNQAPYLTSKRSSVDRHGVLTTRDSGSAGHLLVDLMGERLGAAVVQAVESVEGCASASVWVDSGTAQVPGQAAPASFRDLAPSRSYTFEPDGVKNVPFWLVRLGDILIAGLRAELSSSTGRSIKAASTARLTLVATMVNGGAKYLPDRTAYDRRTYEAMSAQYARGSAELVAEKILSAITASTSPPAPAA